MKKVLSIVTVLILSGCGGPEASWVHANKGQEGFMSDRNACNQRIDETQANFNERFSACMEQRGWRLEAH